MSSLKSRLSRVYDKKVVQRLENEVRTTALDLEGELKVRTPVDTGRARSNWHTDIGTPTVKLLESGGDIRADLSGFKLDQTIFVSNNLPYIGRLNDGHSQQAPAGFVQDAIEVVRARARRRMK